MNSKVAALVPVVVLLLGLVVPPATRADSSQLVRNYLDERGATGYTIVPITDDYVQNTFPGVDFFSVWFRQYPVAALPPEGLAFSNVFFVIDSGVGFLTDPSGLETAFLEGLGPVSDVDAARDVARTWLRLSQEFSQDGFFVFTQPKAEPLPVENPWARWAIGGQVLVAEGGSGEIDVIMLFDVMGNLANVQESRDVQIGSRPI
jgi:hypothetical protein